MSDERLHCTYLIESPIDVEKAAELLASEQSIGSFVQVPGETDDVLRRHGARVEAVDRVEDGALPSLATSLPGLARDVRTTRAVARVSFPVENFAPNLASLFAILLGNLFELQELTGIRLEDVELPASFSDRFPGPAFGVAGTRSLTGIPTGPIIGTIVKPKLGLPPEQIAALVETLGDAGIDFIKDDECLTDPPSAPLAARVAAVSRALDRVADRTGRKPMFAFNVSGESDDMRRSHDLVAAAGGTCIMVSLNACGPSAIGELRRHSTLPLHGHRAGWGMLTRHPSLGISFTAYQKLWRHAGVDHLHVGGLQSKFFEEDASVAASARACLAPLGRHAAVMPVFSSGQWGGQAPETFRQVGSDDLLYLAGGGILGHPLGAAGGVRALREAWEAAKLGIALDDHAATHPALAASIRTFGQIRTRRGTGNG